MIHAFHELRVCDENFRVKLSRFTSRPTEISKPYGTKFSLIAKYADGTFDAKNLAHACSHPTPTGEICLDLAVLRSLCLPLSRALLYRPIERSPFTTPPLLGAHEGVRRAAQPRQFLATTFPGFEHGLTSMTRLTGYSDIIQLKWHLGLNLAGFN